MRLHVNKIIANRIKITTGPRLTDPLCFTAEDAGATITFNKVGNPASASIVYATESSG